jgi:hypothetical protein
VSGPSRRPSDDEQLAMILRARQMREHARRILKSARDTADHAQATLRRLQERLDHERTR